MIVFVSATPFEIAPLKLYLEEQFSLEESGIYKKDELEVLLIVTGVGLTATAFRLGHILAQFEPSLLINVGIAGAIDRKLKIGEVVHVTTEQFGDLGVEEADGSFKDMFDLGLIEASQLPFINGLLYNPEAEKYDFLKKVRGISVQKVHGEALSIDLMRKKYPDAQVESMEGAAVFYSCLLSKVNFLQIRSISNFVEPRNRANWNLPLAIDNLNAVLVDIIENLKD
jgi:futalosine hydrolase